MFKGHATTTPAQLQSNLCIQLAKGWHPVASCFHLSVEAAAEAEAAVCDVIEVGQAEIIEGLSVECIVVRAVQAVQGGPQKAVADRAPKQHSWQRRLRAQVEEGIQALRAGQIIWERLRAFHVLQMAVPKLNAISNHCHSQQGWCWSLSLSHLSNVAAFPGAAKKHKALLTVVCTLGGAAHLSDLGHIRSSVLAFARMCLCAPAGGSLRHHWHLQHAAPGQYRQPQSFF